MLDDRMPKTDTFHPDKLPKYAAGDGEGTKTLDLDCCPEPECPQREYNRACALTLEKLSQAYAALWLIALATPKVWPCNSEGHTEGCTDPSCTYGQDMAEIMVNNRLRLESAIVGLFRTLSGASMDLAGEWTAFTVSEIAGHALLDDPVAPAWVKDDSLGHLQEEAVGSDPREMRRWFQPPKRGGDEPKGHAS